MNRREFLHRTMALGALVGVEAPLLARLLPDPQRLSWRAQRTAGAEGAWTLRDIEGSVPKEVIGTLYRVGPGQSENHGVTLKHIFDGDAFLMGFSFREGRVDFRARFIPTPERLEELEAGRMLYSEVGTLCPGDPPQPGLPKSVQLKNQPSVQVIRWSDRLLGLSEGGMPTAIDPSTFDFQARWDFDGSIGLYTGFTAHPRFDPQTGEGYANGLAFRVDGTADVKLWRMELDGSLTELHSLYHESVPMIHDMLLTERFVVLVIPSVRYDFQDVLRGEEPLTSSFRFHEDMPTRLVFLDREGLEDPFEVEAPAAMVFHHGNAFEKDGRVVFDSCLAPDGSVLAMLESWAEDELPPTRFPGPVRLEVDLEERKLVSRTPLAENMEFPRFDLRRAGAEARVLYLLEGGAHPDAFATGALVRHDFGDGSQTRVEAGKGRMYWEPVFVPHAGQESEEKGWLLAMGYDGPRDESFLDIRDAETLEFQARVWTGNHFPLGFHGNFEPELFVQV